MGALQDLIISTKHAKFDDFPWVEMFPGMELKICQARPDENFLVNKFRAQPFAKSGLHKHMAPLFGITLYGAWSHHPTDFAYKPDSFITEPVDELHRFHNGPDLTEVIYIMFGGAKDYDEEGREEIGSYTCGDMVTRYLERCEELGLARPNILR